MMLIVSMAVKKYFIAIVIPEPVFSEIEALKLELFNRFGLKGALRSPSHITLHRPFVWQEEKQEKLIESLRVFDFDRTFQVEIKNFNWFEPRVIYAGVLQNEALNDLHKALTRHARSGLHLFNEADDLRGFHPHITIAFRDLKKPLFYKLQEEFKIKQMSGSFEYSGFSLLRMEKKWEELQFFERGRQ